MKLTEEDIMRFDSALDNRIMLVEGESVDMVQVSPKWVKFHFKADDSTAVLFMKNFRPEVRDGGISVETKGKTVFAVGKPADDSVFSGKTKLLTGQDLSRPGSCVTSGDAVDAMSLPFDSYGNAVEKFETGKSKDGKDVYFADIAGETVWLEPPMTARAKKINVGGKAKSDKIDFAYRIADLDRPDVPLYGLDKLAGKDEKRVDESVSYADGTGSAAERRMKLFAAAAHEGAELVEDGRWIAAVCYTYRQCHVFGRLKPKVIPGTNEIDPNCNLEDWEGITEENKKMRDDPTLPWVRDGVTDLHGRTFDKLSGESGQPRRSFGCETAWCNCGVLNGDGAWEPRDRTNMYFEYYSNHGKTPYVILMDKERGALYQYVRIRKPSGDIVNFLNEDDKTDGGTVGNPPDGVQMEFFDVFCEANPDFRKLIASLDAKHFS